MASRKEQKEQARAARLAQQQAAATKAQRTRRLQIFGGSIAIAVIVIVVAIVVSSSGGGPKGAHTGLATGKQERQLVKSVNSELSGIPQSGVTLGNPSAKITMTYYGDLECPYCQAFTLEVLPTFIQQEVRPGHVKVVYRSMCTATCDRRRSLTLQRQQFDSQQEAAYAAGQQNKAWQFIELFYYQQESEGTLYANNSFLTGLAKQVPGLNLQKWRAARNDASFKTELASDVTYATKAALPGTPSLIMSGPKGNVLVNNGSLVTSEGQLTAAIKAVS